MIKKELKMNNQSYFHSLYAIVEMFCTIQTLWWNRYKYWFGGVKSLHTVYRNKINSPDYWIMPFFNILELWAMQYSSVWGRWNEGIVFIRYLLCSSSSGANCNTSSKSVFFTTGTFNITHVYSFFYCCMPFIPLIVAHWCHLLNATAIPIL